MFVYMTANNVDTDICIAGVFNNLKNAQEFMRASAEDTADAVGVDISDIQQFEEVEIGPMSWHVYTGSMDGDFYYGCIQELPAPIDKEVE